MNCLGTSMPKPSTAIYVHFRRGPSSLQSSARYVSCLSDVVGAAEELDIVFLSTHYNNTFIWAKDLTCGSIIAVKEERAAITNTEMSRKNGARQILQ